MKPSHIILIHIFIVIAVVSIFLNLEIRAEKTMLQEASKKLEEQERYLENLIKQYQKMEPLVRHLNLLFYNDLETPGNSGNRFHNCFYQIKAITEVQRHTLKTISNMDWVKGRKVLRFWINQARQEQYSDRMELFFTVISVVAPWQEATLKVSLIKS